EVRDPSEFAKFLALTLPKQTYLATRPDAERVEPREAVNPGEDRRPPIPEWRLGFDQTLNSYTPVPLDSALTPQDVPYLRLAWVRAFWAAIVIIRIGVPRCVIH